MISSRQATAARLLLPRSQDVALSVSFSMVKHLAEELKATDYTLTQSSLDQVSEFDFGGIADSHQFLKCYLSLRREILRFTSNEIVIIREVTSVQFPMY